MFSQCRKCVRKKSDQSPNTLTEGLNITNSNKRNHIKKHHRYIYWIHQDSQKKKQSNFVSSRKQPMVPLDKGLQLVNFNTGLICTLEVFIQYKKVWSPGEPGVMNF